MPDSNNRHDRESDSSEIQTEDSDRMGRRRFLSGATSGAIALGALAGCTGDSDNEGTTPEQTPGDTSPEQTEEDPTPTDAQSNGDLATVDVAVLPQLSSIPVYVGNAEGIFEEHGIELNLYRSQSAAQETPSLATGELDIATGSVGASTINAMAGDIGIHVTADMGRSISNVPSILDYQVSDEDYSEGMTIADTEGYTWALNAEGNVSQYLFGRTLSAHGLTFDDVEVTTMPFPQMVSAFEGNSIDAAMLIGGLATQTRAQGLGHHVEYANISSPNEQIGNILTGAPFLNQRYDIAVQWHQAYIEGVRRYYELGPYSQEVINIFTEATDSPPASVYGAPPVYINRNGRSNADSLLRQQAYFECSGQVDNTISRDVFVDTDIVEEALDAVGEQDDPLPSPDDVTAWIEDSDASFPSFGEENLPEEEDCGGVAGL